MLGILFMLLGSLLAETSASASKLSLKARTLTILDTALILIVAGLIPFLAIAAFSPSAFVFDVRSLPTLTLRILIELPLIALTGFALMRAERSTFTLIRTLTIPLLLIVDFALAYPLSLQQALGAGMVTVAIIASARGKISRSGMLLCAISAVMATAAISLYKLDLRYNSVVAEQIIVLLFTFAGLSIAKVALHESLPTTALRHSKKTQLSMIASAGAHVFEAFAFKYIVGTAIIVAVKRGMAVLFSLLSGKAVFREEHFGERLLLASTIIGGIVLMSVPSMVISTARAMIASVFAL